MFTQNDLFAKALLIEKLIEKPWFVEEVKFDLAAGKLEI